MGAGKFLNTDEEQRIVDEIRHIEIKTTGEIHVHLAARESRKGVLADARRTFVKLGMDRARERNGVLIYIALKSRAVACCGDAGITEKHAPSVFWTQVVNGMTATFAKGDYFIGVSKAVEAIGEMLAREFPAHPEESGGRIPDNISRS
ncbi:MAG: TPM domain-containing protein [Deltaproteobacteria bacterium]|nr:TPM domain-containing protein [Deltaproteobacteria bacterium]